MKLIQTETYIRKHAKSNDNIEGNIIEASNMAMGLVNSSELQLFKVDDNIYITNVDTDFILDITMEVWIRFDNEGKDVTVTDLYELYCKAKDFEEEEINKSNELGRIWRLLHFNSRIPKRPFSELEVDLKAILKKSSIQNN
jgi:hypothetical protein